MSKVTFTFDGEAATIFLSSLAEAAKRFPEFGEALVDFIEAGEELFLLKCDCHSAPGTNEIAVGLYPSDSLARLVTAFRARNLDFGLVEHLHPKLRRRNSAQALGIRNRDRHLG
ncbi:hypothetical protein EOA32_03155 [Mesorhizobium sp. M1A.F.Ca.ET.072.01.1.1]|uniref:hypothetical protein n=1 Tax=Mesorhizobium sp. M1A.F.Ca.ET.072.01.1.1 TaxID=2496753 RepID=UPI000FD244E8|nr:hypothetical protein [Mesorhizobium sp. M1A.F.Ca.ET.072.01.1.1]RUW55036.1 hypothetical protein EOA32_03155 [Mesorhizobium sp. M1A.F.Ca.ET.072.01.1.1]TIV04728.1 MAG: hypothetical protein E5W04_02260 [Mesorhizobium sp.]